MKSEGIGIGVENSIVIHRTSQDGLHIVGQIRFISASEFAYCTDIYDDGKLRRFDEGFFSHLVRQYVPYNASEDLPAAEKMLNYHAECLNYEQYWSRILIRPDLDISQIPTEYLLRLIERGKDKAALCDMEMYQKLIDIHRRRYTNFVSGQHGYIFLFSAEGIKRFLETGRLADHVPGLPPFPAEERVAILEHLLATAQQKPGIILRMFRENAGYAGICVSGFDDEMLWISAPLKGDAYRYDVYKIANRGVIRMFRHELLQKILGEYVYSVEETHNWLHQRLSGGCCMQKQTDTQNCDTKCVRVSCN